MDYKSATRFIFNLLSTDLPPNLFYHGLHHTLDVYEVVEELGKEENVSEEEIIILKTAAAFHDCGFVKQYFDHEAIAVTLAERYLPDYGYSSKQIGTISELVLATQIPHKPKNHLEEIICDADLDYLGRDDFSEIAVTLEKEWLALNMISSHSEFNQKQLKFFEAHRYFTETAKRKRGAQKEKHFFQLKKEAGLA
jgi:uncharacterized protein